MISEAETLKSKEFVKRRILRLQQVREQSKDLAKKIRGRVKDERGRILKEINQEKEKEVEKLKQKNIEHLKSQLEKELARVGESHSAAIFEDLVKKEWEVQKTVNRNRAIARGNKAAENLRKKESKMQHHCKSPTKSKTSQTEAKTIVEETEKVENTETITNNKDCATEKEKNQQNQSTNELNERGDGEHIHEQIKQIVNEANRGTVDLGGGGDNNRENIITANYLEVSANKDCDDTLNKFYPVETVRQLQLSEHPPSSKDRPSIRDDSIYSEVNKEPLNLHAMSKNNPFSTVISDHIKNRQQKVEKPVFISTKRQESSEDMNRLKSTIQYSRHAPPPSIPKLPEGYGKLESTIGDVRRKKTDLPPFEMSSPTKCRRQSNDDGCGCRCGCASCPRGEDRVKKKSPYKPNFRQTLKSQNLKKPHSSSSVHTAKSGTAKMIIHCRPPIIKVGSSKSRIAASSDSGSRCNREVPRFVRTYDETNKNETNSMPDSNYLVERIPKSGKSAFELAREEAEEDQRRILERRYNNEQSRKVRGMQAAEKLIKEKEYQDVIKAIDEYEKAQRQDYTRIPEEAFMSDDRLKKKRESEQREMERAYERIERQTKVLIHPNPVTAPLEQPIHSRGRGRIRGQVWDVEEEDDGRRGKKGSPVKKRIPGTNQPAVVNVAEWNVMTDNNNKTDLDEIPTRDSDSTVKSIVETKNTKTADNVQVMDVKRVLDLIDMQREQLLKEVQRMEELKKPKDRVKSPKKKKQIPVVDVQNSSTTDDAVEIVERKKAAKHKSPTSKVNSEKNPGNVVTIKRVDSSQQVSSSSQSSISFQGFQIVVDVKKSGKSSSKSQESVTRAERSVQTTKSFLECQDSSTEVSIKAAKVVRTEKVMFESDDPKSKTFIDSSASTSYMSPPEKFTRHAAETYFGKRAVLRTCETQTDLLENVREEKDSSKKNVKCTWVKRQQAVQKTPVTTAFFGSESTISHEISEIPKRINDKSRSCDVPNKILQPLDQNVPASKLDPRLKSYVHKLLEISKSGINKLDIDVSDVTTPTSSIINVPSNTVPIMRPEYAEKVERMKHFIDENYTLLEQIESEKKFHRNYGKNEQRQQHPEVSSSVNSEQTTEDNDRQCNKENKKIKLKKVRHKVKHLKRVGVVGKTKKLRRIRSADSEGSCESSSPVKLANKCGCCPEGNKKNLNNSLKNTGKKPEFVTVKDSPKKTMKKPVVEDPSESGSPDLDAKKDHLLDVAAMKKAIKKQKQKLADLSSDEQQRNIDHYKRLSDQCTQRIQNLSEMLEKVRRDKQMTLSSSPSSDEGHIPSKGSSNNDEFEPILSNIPKPAVMKSVDPINTPVWEYNIHSYQSPQIPTLDLNNFENIVPEKRPRPPIAMFRNPIMKNADINPGTPHELSTIVEVDTPGHLKNGSTVSKPTEPSPRSHQSFKSLKPIDDIPNIGIDEADKNKSVHVSFKKVPSTDVEIPDVTDIGISPFISFQEFIKEHGISGLDDVFGDTTLKPCVDVENLGSESDDTLPDIVAEMIKRDLIRGGSAKNYSSRNGSGEISTSDSAVYILEESASSGKKSNRKVEAYPLFKGNELPSISGIDEILQTSSNSSISENLMNDFEKALQTMGIHWAVSTLKKTKETMALSSTSSSLHKEPVKSADKNKKPSEDFSNITGTSVGLSTLLGELNTPNDSLFKKYAAELSNSSIHEQLEVLFKKVANIKKEFKSNINISQDNKKLFDNTAKSHKGMRVNLFTEEASISGLQGSKDKTQHRTSTPVRLGGKISSHSTSTASVISQQSGLFSIESDVSSVRNVSGVEKNVTADEKDTLNIPNMNLKFGKLFE